ncbi:MAG TPA: 30S ribosomal protein S20 [Verrucomicrobiota bacterium]|nr:30S ribosomal protein S20 [Verrucomicrobiota bacterium]
MPNTASAERRVRRNERRRQINQITRTRASNLEKKLRKLVAAGQRDDAAKLYPEVSSALDKAAKKGVIPKGRADRKKSRLALKLKPAASAAPASAPAEPVAA